MKRTITTQSLARGFAGLLLAFALTGRQVLAAEPQLVLDKSQPSVSQSFSVTDMLPGDAVEEQYTLQVHRSGVITLLFDVIVTDETGDLGEALNIQVTDATAGTVLASGTFDQVRDQVYRVQLPDGSGRIDRDFTIRVWMDTSVGNEYQNTSLEADFRWYVEGEPAGPDEPAATPAPGQLIPAQTGDPSSLALWIALAAACALALAFIRIKTKGGAGSMNKPNNTGKKALGSALAVLVLAAMLALTTWAALLAMAKTEKNTFLTGAVAIELNGGKTIFSGADLANIEPGHAAVREFTVKNTGTVDVYYRLYLENITGDLADSLVFSIYEGDKNAAQTGTPLYTGAASDFVADGSPFVDGKTLAPGKTRTLTAVVKMGEGSGNAFQGDTVGFDLTAQCVQARNNPDKEFN